MDLNALVEACQGTDPLAVMGLGTRSKVGGAVDPGARVVRAPAGVEWVQAEEMTARCGAATAVAELAAALDEVGQMVNLPAGGTVGGALAVGLNDVYRLGHGHLRDVLLQADVVLADGRQVTCGGPTVKNVSGFDLCRMLVGSLGKLAVIGDVIVRTRPRPPERRWFTANASDPEAVRARVFRPASVLWDGVTVWVCLEGHGRDIDAAASSSGFAECDGPPELPTGGRWSLDPATVVSAASGWAPGSFVAEIGVGVVHHTLAAPARPVDPAVRVLHERLLARFDPTGRLNPGRLLL